MLHALVLIAAGQAGLILYDEGSAVGGVTRINCSGSGITCSAAGRLGTITVTGGGPGGGAPTDAKYITQTCHADLSTEQCMSALETGLVLNTTTTGVQSIYAGATCTSQFVRSLNRVGAASCSSVDLSSDTTGTLSQAKGGTGAGAVTCSAGQALTSNGTAYSCTSAITASSVSGGNVSGAVATATALAADPADCALNRYATGIATSGALTCAQVDLAAGVTGTLPPANGGATATVRITTSNKTSSSTTPATTGLSWTAVSGVEYGFECVLTSTGTATALARFNLNGPGSSTVSFVSRRFTTTSAETLLVMQAFSASSQTAACTSSCNTTQLPTYVAGTVLAGGNGTIDLQYASSTSGQTVTIHRGSYCRVY